MKEFIRNLKIIIKQLFCDHIYGGGKMNPYIDSEGNHSAVYTCIKCGYKDLRVFK